MRSNKLTILTLAIFFSISVFAQRGDIATPHNADFASNIIQENQIELYPNPAVDYLTIEINSSEFNNVEFELHSIIGNKIRINPEEIEPNKYIIPLKEFSSGYYFLVVKDEFSRFKKAYKFLKN